MSEKKKRDYMEKLHKCYNVIRQSRTGISAVDVAQKVGMDRTTVYNYLNSLELAEKIQDSKGLWFVKDEKTTRSPPIPALLERIFVQTDEINELLHEKKKPEEAFSRTIFLVAQLEKPMKEEMKTELEKVRTKLKSISTAKRYLFGELATAAIYHNATVTLVSKLYSLIYAQYSMKDLIGSKVLSHE